MSLLRCFYWAISRAIAFFLFLGGIAALPDSVDALSHKPEAQAVVGWIGRIFETALFYATNYPIGCIIALTVVAIFKWLFADSALTKRKAEFEKRRGRRRASANSRTPSRKNKR